MITKKIKTMISSVITPRRKSAIRRRLSEWFMKHHRSLPWRETKNAYHIWVSEVMLQQTQVISVIPYYQRFLIRFPDLQTLAQSDIQDVLKLWEGLGYYARARHLHESARIIMTACHGVIPNSRNEFIKLPGVGDYTASAVLSIAFDQTYAAVDGNVRRVLARLFELDAPVNAPCSAKLFQSAADDLLDSKAPGQFNQAVMELGALICKPSDPGCPSCPVCKHCGSHLHQTADQFPRRIKRKPVPQYHVAAGLVFKGDHFLITRRSPDGFLGGLWEIPGGKVKENENPKDACARELLEETALVVRVHDRIAQVKHAYTHFKIVMDVFRCHVISGDIRLNGPVDYRWIQFDQIDEYPFPKADLKSFDMIRASFAGSQL